MDEGWRGARGCEAWRSEGVPKTVKLQERGEGVVGSLWIAQDYVLQAMQFPRFRGLDKCSKEKNEARTFNFSLARKRTRLLWITRYTASKSREPAAKVGEERDDGMRRILAILINPANDRASISSPF